MTWETLFFKNHTQNVVEKLFPGPFLKKLKLSISLDQKPKFLNSLFSLYAKLRAIEISWNQAAEQMLLP